MANKLTKHKSGITIVTEDFVNAMYGGLYNPSDPPPGISVDDPLVAGHVHDGLHYDGHAQKINLSDHVTGQLDGANIQDGTISNSKLQTGSGGVKYANFFADVSLGDYVDGSATSYTPFTSEFNIPTGTVSDGDMLNLSLVLTIDPGPSLAPSPEITSNFYCKVEVGGIESINPVFSGTVTSGDGNSPLYWGVGGCIGGFKTISGNKSLVIFGLYDFNLTNQYTECGITSFPSFSSIDNIRILFKWDVGANPAAVAYLNLFQSQIISSF